MTCEGELVCINCGSEMILGMCVAWMPINGNVIMPIEIETTIEQYRCSDCGYEGSKIRCKACKDKNEWV